MSVLTPELLGFPPKFKEFYLQQEKAILDLAESKERFITLCAPTGAGKSAIYMALARLLEWRTAVCVSKKGLQDQLGEDFSSLLVDVRGQNNYACKALRPGGELESYGKTGGACDEGPCRAGVRCTYRDSGCEYYDRVYEARDSDCVLTNYFYWLSINKFVVSRKDKDSNSEVGLGSFRLLVLDEADLVPDILTDFCAIEVNRLNLASLIGVDKTPTHNDNLDVWASWASECLPKATKRQRDLKERLQQGRKATKDLIRVRNLIVDLQELSGLCNEDEFVVQKMYKGSGYVVSPVWGSHHAEDYLFSGADKVVLLSATVDRNDAKNLGIDTKKDYRHIELPSTFHPKRRQLVFLKTTPPIRVDFRVSDNNFRFLVSRMDLIIRAYPNWKGVIHSRSYKWADRIAAASQEKSRLITHTRYNAKSQIQRFFESSNLVLVSPIVEEGYDFPDDLCRFQIILKVPFLDTRPPVIAARKKKDKNYPTRCAARSIVQSVGRGTRHKKDFCVTYIMDDHFSYFKNKAEFPSWFSESITISKTVLDSPDINSLPTDRRLGIRTKK